MNTRTFEKFAAEFIEDVSALWGPRVTCALLIVGIVTVLFGVLLTVATLVGRAAGLV